MTPRRPTAAKSTTNVIVTRSRKQSLLGLPTPQVVVPSRPTSAPLRRVIRLPARKVIPGREHVPYAMDKVPACSVIYLNSLATLHRACIDSGSAISIIDLAYLKTYYPNAKIQPCTEFIVSGVGSCQIQSYVTLEAGFRGKDQIIVLPIRFYIKSSPHTKVLIGNDVLQEYNAVLDFRRQAMWFSSQPGMLFPLVAYSPVSRFSVASN